MSPFDEGREGYSGDLSLSDNPYDEGTDAYFDWQSGWIEAEENDPFSPENL